MSFDAFAFRQQFPFFQQNPDTLYWDNAATTQKPEVVIKTMVESLSSATNVHRSSYALAAKKTEQFESARRKIADFIGAQAQQLVFTRGSTEAINMIAHGLTSRIAAGDIILLSQWEHHANILPWQDLAKRTGATVKFVSAEQLLSAEVSFEGVKVLALTAMSNVMGTGLWSEALLHKAQQHDVITVVDGAQAVVHTTVDVSALAVDAYVFSGHKLYAPEGIGAAYISPKLQQLLTPFLTGGEMIRSVTEQGAEYKHFPYSHEAGTQNISAAIAFAAAIGFFQPVQIAAQAHVQALSIELIAQLQQRPIKFLHQQGAQNGIISIYGEFDSLDMAMILAEQGICVRAGKHCAEPLLTSLGLKHCLRLSLAPYNLEDEISFFITAFDQALALLKH